VLSDDTVVAPFIVSDDIDRSRPFYTEILGGEAVVSEEPTYVALANSWVIINVGGGPADDRPDITLETPRERDLIPRTRSLRLAAPATSLDVDPSGQRRQIHVPLRLI
jgi:hypothetical protein